jgi:hypothetical protein
MNLNWNDPKEWIFDQCCKDGSIELSKKNFEHFFPGNAHEELAKLQEFCKIKGITLTIDGERKTFKFTLIEPDL